MRSMQPTRLPTMGHARSSIATGSEMRATTERVVKASTALKRPETLVQKRPPAITTTGVMSLAKEAAEHMSTKFDRGLRMGLTG